MNNRWNLKINDRERSIQDVHIPSRKVFNIIKSSIISEYEEGFCPTKANVKQAIHNYYHPDKSIVADFKKSREEIYGQPVRFTLIP